MKAIKKAIRHSSLYQTIKMAMVEKSIERWTKKDQEMVVFYNQFVKAGDLCFDVGANMGNRTKIFLSIGARVVAVEPQDHCMRFLKEKFGENHQVILIQKAVGERDGMREMMISEENAISSLSAEWIETVQRSGRFSQFRWPKRQMVQLTTIDNLIHENGQPSFIKIDIEGYEYEALKGMTKPVKCLSFEFTPEFMDAAYGCIQWLSSLGDARFNYAIGERMQLVLPAWLRSQRMLEILSQHENDNIFGDVYVRFRLNSANE